MVFMNATIGDRKGTNMTIINSTAPIKAHKALHVIKEYSPTLLATRPNLYKLCLDGVAIFEKLRPRVTTPDGSGTYCSLAGQRFAAMVATASLDNVLTVLIYETIHHKWGCDVVTDIPGLIFGSPVSEPFPTREEAEQAALAALGMLGAEQKPAADYEPISDPDTKHQIRLNDESYIVSDMPEEWVRRVIIDGMREFRLTEDALLARFARTLLQGNPSGPVKGVLLTLLANCGWTHVTQEVHDDFCAANGIDMGEAA
jgi:hypothetical protein